MGESLLGCGGWWWVMSYLVLRRFVPVWEFYAIYWHDVAGSFRISRVLLRTYRDMPYRWALITCSVYITPTYMPTPSYPHPILYYGIAPQPYLPASSSASPSPPASPPPVSPSPSPHPRRRARAPHPASPSALRIPSSSLHPQPTPARATSSRTAGHHACTQYRRPTRLLQPEGYPGAGKAQVAKVGGT